MALIADHFDECPRCSKHVITGGVYRSMMRNSPHLCRCEELEKLSITTKPRKEAA